MGRTIAVLVAAALALTACLPGADHEPGHDGLTVLAAASLTDAIDVIASDFGDAHDVPVTVGVGGSQQLATQILEGAPADVFASADTAQMDRVVDAGLAAGQPEVFARNELVVIVGPGIDGITSVTDLAQPSLRVVLAAPEVPAGAYTEQVLDRAGVSIEAVSLETNVRSVRSKVVLGEADAGIVYASDLWGVDADLRRIELPDDVDVVAAYPAVALGQADRPELARAFVEFLRSPAAQARLRGRGLQPVRS